MVEGVIMASATSVPVQGTKAIPSAAISKVLLTDPVRRLFNQPNIVIHAIPRNNSPTAFRMVSPKYCANKKNDINGEYQLPNKAGVSIQLSNPSSNETEEEENLLPSKNNGKSEILLVPIVRKRKECGHFEPCESLVCNVAIQQYKDDNGITPLISINIDESEIDASVTKHCKNEKCDALSIDHDSCRRALIQLYHCDKCIMCDICGITFQCRKARLNHKKCRRKETYQHNTATPSDILKIRMRERELQILEATRLKRSCDYLDPVMGFNRTMEALKKNDELVIIPKNPPKPSQNSMLNFSSINKFNNSTSIVNNNNNNNNNNNIKAILGNKRMPSETDKELTSEMISNIILSCQNSIDSKKRNGKSTPPPLKQIKISDHLNGAIVDIRDTPNLPLQQCIKFTGITPNNVNSITMKNQHQTQTTVSADLPKSNLHLIIDTTESEANKSVSTESLKQLNVNDWVIPSEALKSPLKIVPSVKSKSELPTLHQTQGVPKSRIESKKTVSLSEKTALLSKKASKLLPKQVKRLKSKLVPKTVTKAAVEPVPVPVLNSGKFRPLQPALAGNVRNLDQKLVDSLLSKSQKLKKRRRKKYAKKGRFSCSVCLKKFTSLKYCKMHEQRHKIDPAFFCKICEKGFLSRITMNKHIVTDHKPGQMRCEMCNTVLPSLQELSKHMKCPEIKTKSQCSECLQSFDTCSSLDFHMRKEHGFVFCGVCKRQIANNMFKKHLMLEHSISKNRLSISLEKLSCPPGENDEVCEVNLINTTEAVEETVTKTELINENKVEMDCIAKNRSVRRRSSKEFFICTVCERRFENEKQYQIHLANNPMKFTPCPVCNRKFHKKSDYTEHSKSCQWKTSSQVTVISKKKKLNATNEEINIKSDNGNKSRNSIDQKQNENLDSVNCKKMKLDEEKIVQKNQGKSHLKTTVEAKIMNGLKPNSSDCLEKLKIIKIDNNIQKNEDYDVINCDDKDLLLNAKSSLTNSNESTVFDKSIAVSNIKQDHNYQALQ